MTLNFNPAEYNFSYSEWRRAIKFSGKQNEDYTQLISNNCRPDCNWEEILGYLKRCLDDEIPPSYLMIGLLYSSYHIASKNTIPLMEYLIEHHSGNLDLTVTSISTPRCMIPHAAATHGSHRLLCLYYQYGGDINAKDGRNLSAFRISVGNSYYHCMNVLLWQNAHIPFTSISQHVKSLSLDKLLPLSHQWMIFCNDIETCESLLNTICMTQLPSDCVQVILEHTLPLGSYRYINSLLKIIQEQRPVEWRQIEDEFLKTIDQTSIASEERIAQIGFGGKPDLWTAFKSVNVPSDPKILRANLYNPNQNSNEEIWTNITSNRVSQSLFLLAAAGFTVYMGWKIYQKRAE